MSREVDERVVSMKFDNRNFEANVNETMSTIDKLKKKLVFERDKETFKPIEDSARRINFNPLEKGIEKVKIKFSALQVVGATALSEITKSAMHLSGVMNKTFSLLTSGGMARALNVENAKHQLEGLGVAWDKVGDSIQTAVQGTAYGSDEASAVASQLVASGIKIRKNAADVDSEMDHALQSIAGVAAMTNSSYSEIGDIYTTIAGQGKLMGMQLQQLSTRGMNGAAALGKALGKTEAEIREMTRKGQIDFVTFSEAMYKQFAEFSQSADKTYEGSLANMQAAIKRIGQDVASGHLANMQKIFVNAKKAINDFHTALMPVINVINTALAGAAHIATRSIQILNDTINDSGSAFTSIADVARHLLNIGTPLIALEKEFERAGVSTKQFKKAMMQTAKEHGVNVKKMIKEDGSYRNSLKRGWLTNEIFEESVERIIKTQKKSGKSTKEQIKQLKALKDQTGKTGSVVDQNLKMMEKATGGQLFRDSIKNIFYGLKNSIQSIKEAYKDIFPKSETMGLYTLIDRFNKLTKKLKLNETQMDRMKRIFKGVFAVIDLVKIAVKSLVDGLSNLGKALSGDVNFTFGEFLARIGDLLVKFHDWVKENKLIETSISGFCKWLGKAITNVRDFFKSFANSKGFDSFGELLADLFEKFTNDGLPLLKEISSGLLGKVSEFFKNIFDGIKDSTVLSNFINYLSGMNDELDETATWFDKLVYLAKGGKIIIEGVFTALKDFFTSTWDKVWPKIEGVITKIKEKINNFNWGAPASFMVSYLAYKLAQDLLNTIKIVKGPFEAFEKFTKALTASVMDLTVAAKKLISAKAFKMIAQGMMYICASIIILAAAMDKFGTDKVLIAAGTLAVFALIVGKVTSSLLYATQSLNASQMKRLSQLLVIFAGGLLAMSAAFAVIAYAVKNLNPDQMVAAGVVLGALAVGLVALCKFGLNQLPVVNGRVENLTKALFPFIGAITALSLAIYFMGKLNTGQLVQGLGALVVTLVGLAGVIFAMSKIPGEGKLGRTMFGIAAGVLVMTTALTILSQIKLENLLEGVINLGVVIVALAGVFLTTRLLSKTSAKAGATVVGAALSLFAIVIALQWIHNMDAKALFNGVKAFVPLFIALGVVSLLAGGVGESVHKAALTMMGAALSVAILAGALAALSLLPVEGMVKGIGAIWALLLGLGVMIKSVGGLSDAKIKDASKIFVAVTTTAIALMAGLAILSMFDTVSLLAASASIYAVFISMGALLRAIEHAQGVRISGSVIRTIAIATLVVGSLVALTAALNALFKADAGASVVYIAAAVAVLAYAMIPIARAIQVMSTIKMRGDIAKTVVGLAAGIAAMTILVGIIAGIASGKKIGPEILTITGSMILLAVAMVPLAAAMRVLGSVPIPITIQSLAPLGIGVLALMGLIALMAAIPEKACKAAVKGASYLGQVVGALIGGFKAGIAEGVMGTLPTLAGYIREFIAELKPAMQNLGEFPAGAIKGAAVAVAAITLMAVVAAECVPIAALSMAMLAAGLAINIFALELIPFFKLLDKHVDQKAVDKVDIISNIMLKLGAASFLSAFSNLMDNLSRFAFGKDDSGKLIDMAAMAIAFCDATKDLTVEQVSKADTAAKVISTLAGVKLPKKGGFIQAIVGHEDWEGFGKGLEGMAKGLKVLSEQTAGINIKAIDKVIPIMEKLFKLEMPKDTTGSFIGFMTGNTIPMDRFGNQMTSFGEALVAFNESTKGISSDESTIKGLNSVVGIMTALFSIKMPKDTHGTAAGFFTGDTESMSSMGTDLNNFASNFVAFSNTLAKMDPDVVANVDTMMQSMSKIQNTQYSGIEQTIKESTEKASGDAILDGMKTAGNKVKEKGTPIIQSALSATADAVDPTSGSLGTNIASIGGDFMNQLGTGFIPGAGSIDISGTIENTLTKGVENTDITKLQKEAESIGSSGLDGLTTGIKSKVDEVSKATTDASKAAWNSTGEHVKEAKEAGTTQAGAFTKELGSSKAKSKAKKSVTNLANAAAADENFRAAKTNMVKNGAWLIEGLIEGINSKKAAVKSKMKEVTDDTNTVVTKTDEISSPSKLYRRFGGWLMEGFALGIDDNAYKVTKSMSKAMKAANDKAKKSMKGGKNLMASFARQFFNTDALKTTKQLTNAAKLASAAIKRLSYDLYKSSDYFKQDKENLKKARKEVKKASAGLKEAKKNRKSHTKEVKKSTKETKGHTKTVKKSTTATKKNNTQVKNASKNLKNARKELKKVKKEINKHINKSALQDTINGIANTIRSFVSISNVSFGSGQNIFEEYFSPNADELQENLNTVEDIKKEIESTQEEINKLNNINTRVAQKQVSELNERLEELNDQLDKAQETVDKANAISADELLNNVKSNEQGLIDYLSNRKMLDNSGLSTSLIRYIKDMGIEGNNMMVAALSLSNDQIKEINESYMNWKHQEGLMWMEDFKDRLKKVNSFSSVLGDLADKLPQKFLMEAANMGLDANDLLESLREFSNSELKDLNTLYSDSLSIDTKAAKDIVASFARAGMDSAKGFGEGLAKGTSSAVKSANKFAKKIQNEVEKALGLGKKKKKKKASTKKKAKATGGSYAVDVVNGFEEEVNELVTGDNGYSPLDALSNALNDLSNPENAPIITPVLDLTNVSNGALTIQDLLNNGYTLAGSSNFAMNMNSEATNARLAAFQTSVENNFASLQNLLNGYLENGQNATVTNNFNINSSSPKEVADEVSRILQKQVERRQATWA